MISAQNSPEWRRTIFILPGRSTPAARDAYNEQAYQMLLYILDEDEKNIGEQKRKVIYSFPPQFIKQGKIQLNQLPVEAKFELIPLTPEKPASAAGS